MAESSYAAIIREMTVRALWEVQNVIACIPDALWEKRFYKQPVWKHVYHMLHSLDLYFINPCDVAFIEPAIHGEGLNDLDCESCKILTRDDINDYFSCTKDKVTDYIECLCDGDLLTCPEGCPWTRFNLILAQHRHLHTHMGMLMGFIVSDTGKWPLMLGLRGEIPPEGTKRDKNRHTGMYEIN